MEKELPPALEDSGSEVPSAEVHNEENRLA
jgi:hypothetical protein